MSSDISDRSRHHNMARGLPEKAVFNDRISDNEHRRIFSDAPAAPRLWYNAATQGRISKAQRENLDRWILRRLCPLSGIGWNDKEACSSNVQVLIKTQELSAMLHLHFPMPHYFPRPSKLAPGFVIAVIQATPHIDTAFTKPIKGDLVWHHVHIIHAEQMYNGQSLGFLLTRVCCRQKSGVTQTFRACQANSVRLQCNVLSHRQRDKDLNKMLPNVASAEKKQAPEERPRCMCECGQCFAAKENGNIIRAAVISSIIQLGAYARGIVCKVYCTQYHALPKLVKHRRAQS